MIPLDALVLSVIGELPVEHGTAELGLIIDQLEVALPIESRLGADGRLHATAPRGRLRTGFDQPHGVLALGFVARPA
mgnify:FL=1|jgi:hypothetical protein